MTKARFTLAHNDPSVMSGWQLMNKSECVNQGGLSRGTLFSQVKGSLERLGTTYIDVLVISGDQNMPVPETMKALHDLVHKVRYIGASNVYLRKLAEMNNIAHRNHWTAYLLLHPSRAPLLYRPEEIEMFTYCNLKGIGIFVDSPFMDGRLARPVDTQTERYNALAGTPLDKPRRDSNKEIIKRVEEIVK